MQRITKISSRAGVPVVLTGCLLAGAGAAFQGCSSSPRPTQSQSGASRAQTTLVLDATTRTSMRDEAIGILMDAALSTEPLLRANAIEGLQGAPSQVESVARAGLRDENLGVRFVAAMTIGELKLRSSLVFVEPLLNDPSKIVQAAAIYALRHNGQKVDPSVLASMLESRDPTERAQAAFILGELGDASAVGMLRSAARRSSPLASLIADRLVRLQIAEALVKLGDLEAIETIRAALYPSRPEDLEATALAVQIIGNVNDRRSIDQLVYLTAREGPEKMPAEIRMAAAISLAKLGNRRGAFIGDEYWQDENPAIRSQAAFVLGETVDSGNADKLRQLMGDPVGYVKVAAASATLGAIDRGPQTASVDTQR